MGGAGRGCGRAGPAGGVGEGRGCSGIVPWGLLGRVFRQMRRGVSWRGLGGGARARARARACVCVCVCVCGRGLLEWCRALAGNRDAHLGVLSETWERLAIREVSFQHFPEPLHSERRVHSRDGM